MVPDDDLGALAASFNRMLAGLAERQRLQVVRHLRQPVLASRLLEQGDDVFTGERRDVTVISVDIRDFTPFAEANTAEETVARLNALFEIVVPSVVRAGGHVNKFLGDGALAMFGAPDDLADHADAAVGAAVMVQRLVAQNLASTLPIGIGINSGVVIAGTIGGGGKLEFTLIGDTVNVAARVEQLTKPRRRDLAHPANRRRPALSAYRACRAESLCAERQVGRGKGLRARSYLSVTLVHLVPPRPRLWTSLPRGRRRLRPPPRGHAQQKNWLYKAPRALLGLGCFSVGAPF